jgi:hypothetical protein
MVIRGDRATISEGKHTFEVEIRVNTAAKSKQIETKREGLYLDGYLRAGRPRAPHLSN